MLLSSIFPVHHLLTGEFEASGSSAFPPIGTDEKGLALAFLSITLGAFSITSLIELLLTQENKAIIAPDKESSE